VQHADILTKAKLTQGPFQESTSPCRRVKKRQGRSRELCGQDQARESSPAAQVEDASDITPIDTTRILADELSESPCMSNLVLDLGGPDQVAPA
jgi:hypothetical protein